MNKLLGFTVLISAVLFSSCDKEISTEEGGGGNFTGNTTSTTLLQRFILLEGTDTTAKYDYTYDSRNRCIKNHGLFYTGGLLFNEQTFFPVYDTNDSFPSRISYYNKNLIFNDTDSAKEYFYYNSSRKMIGDSLVENDNNFGLGYHYSYPGNYINVTTSFGDEQRTYQTVAGNNVTSERDSIFEFGTYHSLALINTTFDTHPNPFYRTEVKRPVDFNIENSAEDYSKVPQQNNPLDEVRKWIIYINDHFTYSYTYRADGLPATVTINELNSGTIQRGVYIY